MASTDTGVTGPTRARIGARTLRPDRWWLSPLVTFVVFTAFVVYATWRAFAGEHYYASPYLSPFYSPCMGQQCVEGSADFGRPFDWFPYSPALIILIVPLGFRMTCYYYRKAYYRAFWLSPPACAVAEPHGSYSGETRLPLVLQNLHRWFLILSALVAMVLTYDVVLLPLVPAPDRWTASALLEAPGALPAVDLGEPHERPPPSLRLAVPVLRGPGRPLRVSRGVGADRRREVLLR
jgi:hypothetical protein